MYRESREKVYTYTMCMCILKHSRSCKVKGMAEVRDVETRRLPELSVHTNAISQRIPMFSRVAQTGIWGRSFAGF